MMNFENVKKILMEGTEEKAQNILQITNTIKEKDAAIEEVDTVILSLQDLMNDVQEYKAVLEAEREALVTQLEQKRTITDSINDVFTAAKKAMKPTVEVVNTVDFSQQVSSTINKLRYDHRKGAINDEEFKEGLNVLKNQIDEELNK